MSFIPFKPNKPFPKPQLFNLRLFLAIWLCLPFASSQAETFAPRVIVFGDSLSVEGKGVRGTPWVQILRERLLRQPAYQEVKVINHAQGWLSLASALPSIRRKIDSTQADIVVLALGTKDVAYNYDTEQQFNKRLDDAIDTINQSGAKGILVGTQLTKTMQRRSKVGNRMPSLYKRVANQYSWPLAQWSLASLSAQPGGLMLDGVHPSAKSQPQLEAAVWGALEITLNELKQQRTITTLPSTGPEISNVLQ